MVAIQKYRKFANFTGLYFSYFTSYSFSRPNFGILQFLKGSFQKFRFSAWICLDQKLVYNANGPLINSYLNSVVSKKTWHSQ